MSGLLLQVDDAPLLPEQPSGVRPEGGAGKAAGKAMEAIQIVLKGLRVGLAGLDEFTLRDAVLARLEAQGVLCKAEFVFAPRCRADIWVPVGDAGIVLELKKQRPVRADVLKQLGRYAKTGRVRGLILVLERHVAIPSEIEGVPCAVVSLRSQWGLAV